MKLAIIADAAALRVADVVDHATANVAEMVSEPTR